MRPPGVFGTLAIGKNWRVRMKKLLTTLAAASLMVLSANAARAEAYIGGALGVTSMSPTVAEDSVSDWKVAIYGAGTDCDSLGC